MNQSIDLHVVRTLASRTFRHSVESPVAYIVAIFFYGFIGALFGANYFYNDQASASYVSSVAPWVLWFVVPALTMGLISEELRSGTYEQLATLPVRDWEIVLGKFFGFALLSLILVAGLAFFALIAVFTSQKGQTIEMGADIGLVGGLYLLTLFYGAMGLFASSLTKNQVVALITGIVFCTFFFFTGQFVSVFPSAFARVGDFIGVTSHLESVCRGVWDVRDLLYFFSFSLLFLYLTVQRLNTRRF